MSPAIRIHQAGPPSDRPAIVLLHGMQDSARGWSPWLPLLESRHLLLPDLPGHGESPPPAGDYAWTIAGLANDLRGALAPVLAGPCHLVAAKLSGQVAVEMVHAMRGSVLSLTLVGAPMSTVATGSVDLRSNLSLQSERGTAAFLAETQRARIGSDASPELVRWLDEIMAGTDPGSALGVAAMAAKGVDVTTRLPSLGVPTLMIAARGSALMPPGAVRSWADLIPGCVLHLVESDAYHLAAARPAECAAATLRFIQECEQARSREG